MSDLFVSLSIRSGDSEWHEGQAGGAGEGEGETAGQEGAVQGAPAVSGLRFHPIADIKQSKMVTAMHCGETNY